MQSAPTAGFALEFNGQDSYVDLPTLRYDGSHPITLEATIFVYEIEAETFRRHRQMDGLEFSTVVSWPEERAWLRNCGTARRYRQCLLALSRWCGSSPTHMAAVHRRRSVRLFIDWKHSRDV